MISKILAKTLFRAATIDDCYTIAQLFRISSEGVSDYVWSTLADDYPDLTPIEIGAKRHANSDSLFSYKNCILAEEAGEIVGMMLTSPVADAEETVSSHAVPQEIPPALTPEVLEAPGTWHIGHYALFTHLQPTSSVETKIELPTRIVMQLSEPDVLAPYSLEAPGTWYICALALFPKFCGQGIGTQFLKLAHQQAAERGFSELSLLCFEQNTEAVKLYQRHRFQEIDRTRVVPHPLIHHTGDILLMTVPVRN